MANNLYDVTIYNSRGFVIETTKLRINEPLIRPNIVTAFRDKPSRPKLKLRINNVIDGRVYATRVKSKKTKTIPLTQIDF